MPKYLLFKHYHGGPESHRPVPPIDQWAPEGLTQPNVVLHGRIVPVVVSFGYAAIA